MDYYIFFYFIHQMNLKPKIIAHEMGNSNKIIYVLEVTNESNQKTKISKLRYSEFKDIHD
jgi:hypothetical protein